MKKKGVKSFRNGGGEARTTDGPKRRCNKVANKRKKKNKGFKNSIRLRGRGGEKDEKRGG